MITKIECGNFYSVGDIVSLRFIDSKKALSSIKSGSILPKSFALIGPNASGKTNLLKVIPFIRHLICETYDIINEMDVARLNFEPNVPMKTLPSYFDVQFIAEGRIFEYLFKVNTKRILEETLSEFSTSSKRFTKKTLFSRRWLDKQNEYAITGNTFLKIQKGEVRPNVSLITLAARQADNNTAKLIYNYWFNIDSNIFIHGHIDDSVSNRAKHTLRILSMEQNGIVSEKVKDKLRKLDLGFEDFFIENVPLPNGRLYQTYNIVHKYSNEISYNTSIDDESSGTKRLFSILAYCLRALEHKNDGVVIIDEIDAFLHPIVVKSLIDMFNDPEINNHSTQIIFSTHNISMLKGMSKRQIILTEKKDGFTSARFLSDIKNVRTDSSFLNKYLAGEYGAIPHISKNG